MQPLKGIRVVELATYIVAPMAARVMGDWGAEVIKEEAYRLVGEGVCSLEDLDKAVELGLGHPMGPFKLMDMTGIDVAYFVRRDRFAESGYPNDAPSQLIIDKYNAGEYGRKTGKGWYEYPAK